MKTRNATKTFTRTLLPWAGAGWGATEAGGADGAGTADTDETGGTGGAVATPGALRTAAPHLLQNLTSPTGEPHCLQKAMKLRSLVVVVRGGRVHIVTSEAVADIETNF